MKFPQLPEDLKNEILISSDKIEQIGDLRIRQLIRILPKVKEEVIVEGIIQVFEIKGRTDILFQDQRIAGRILEEINPKSDLALSDILKRTLSNWNKSIYHLPFWFRDNYGQEKVAKDFDKYESQKITEMEKDKLKTMRRFLRI